MKPTRKPTGVSSVLDEPRRPGEVLEPQPRQQVVQAPAAPPVIDLADDPGVVGFGRPAERERRRLVGHRAVHAAATAAATAWSGTSGPNVWAR